MTSLETLVAFTHVLYKSFALWDDRGLDARERFADTVLPYLAAKDRKGASMTIREEFLEAAQELMDGGGRWIDYNAEHRALGIIDAVKNTFQSDVLVRKLTEWV